MKRFSQLFPLILTFVVLAALVNGSAFAQNSKSNAVEARANEILSQMSLDERIKMLSGTPDQMHVPGVPRLNVPELKFSDGPVGVRCYGRSTAYPCGAMLAATWDTNLAREYGSALGHDSRARGVHVLLAPGVDLYRVPQCGRNFEYFGEDPFLAAQMTVGYILGVQGEHVATSVKHYAANDQETLRDSVNTIVSERRLHEICFAPFKAAVQDANAWTVMAAYNKVNGFWCTASKELLTDVLRNQWNFKGVLMSDWGAVHDCLGPLTAGTDLEMGTTKYYTAENIKRYLQEGKVSQAEIDEHVRRLLRMSLSLGFFDHPQEDKSIPLDNPTAAATALKVAREGLTLLKNQDDFLPMNRADTRSIVVLGPNACPAVIGGGGSSYTDPFRSLSLFDAIVNGAGSNIDVQYIAPCPDANPTGQSAFNYNGVFEPLADGQRGVKAEYFENSDLQGVPKITRSELSPSHWWGDGHPIDTIASPEYSVRWSGKIKATQKDDYVLALSSDGARVFLDRKPLFDTWSHGGIIERESTTMPLNRNDVHDLVIEYHHHARGPGAMQFTWGKATDVLTANEMAAIRNADAVVYAAGYNPGLESEGFDRTYDLPGDQASAIRNLARLNKRLLIVLNAGGNVAMQDWIDSVQALIHSWYPGQNGNQAVAEALFGDLNPSGHLPDTFEKRWQDSPAYGNYPGDPANGGTVKYEEGIYTGYRWYDKKDISPRFPFGFGLSYTKFRIDALNVVQVLREPDLSKGSHWTVTAKVTNTGARAGACVAQLYVRPVNGSTDRPVQELKGFTRLHLQAGQSENVQFTLDKTAYATYDEHKHDWTYPPGQYEIALGTSSRDISCSRTVTFE